MVETAASLERIDVPVSENLPGVCAIDEAKDIEQIGEQLSLFPELAENETKPKSLGILKNGNKTMLFVKEYFLTGNATQSVLKAGYNCTKESARRMGHELLTRHDIREALAYLDKQISEDAIVSKLQIVQGILTNVERLDEMADKAEKAGDYKTAAGLRRAATEDRKLLTQIKGMLREKVEFTGTSLTSFAELEKQVELAEAAEKANKEVTSE